MRKDEKWNNEEDEEEKRKNSGKGNRGVSCPVFECSIVDWNTQYDFSKCVYIPKSTIWYKWTSECAVEKKERVKERASERAREEKKKEWRKETWFKPSSSTRESTIDKDRGILSRCAVFFPPFCFSQARETGILDRDTHTRRSPLDIGVRRRG